MDQQGIHRLAEFLESSIHREYGNEWEVGWYPDGDGPVITVSCCRTHDAVVEVALQEISTHVARQSSLIGYRLTPLDTHDTSRPIISFRAE